MALVHLIYVSGACGELGAEDLVRVLDSSVRWNERHHITGMLLYLNGSFMQVLEGEEAAVDETYLRILQDQRHAGLVIIERESIESRSFGRWWMGFKHMESTDVSANPAFFSFGKPDLGAAAANSGKGLALDLLLNFARHQGG